MAIAVGKAALYQKKIKDHALQDDIILTDYVSDAERNCLLEQAGFLIMPSLYEGFGLPIVEAMQYNLTLILADIPIFHEIAAEAAYYVDPYDHQAIAGGLISCLQDKALQRKLSAAATERGAIFCGWEKSTQQTLTLIESLHEESNANCLPFNTP